LLNADAEREAGLIELRCHSCSHRLGMTARAMELVAQFKASLFGRVPPSHREEIRKRCRSCGWVNVFHPAAGT
jgi:DNA-directed RNA polymerase subunit RPC12/RpoP